MNTSTYDGFIALEHHGTQGKVLRVCSRSGVDGQVHHRHRRMKHKQLFCAHVLNVLFLEDPLSSRCQYTYVHSIPFHFISFHLTMRQNVGGGVGKGEGEGGKNVPSISRLATSGQEARMALVFF